MTRLSLFLRIAANRSILTTAVTLAVVVGVILNVINQGDRLLGGELADVHWTKFGLTFCVPFCVSVFSATKAKMHFDPGTRALVDAKLRCATCGAGQQDVQRGAIVEECATCGDRTRWSVRTER